MSKPSARCTLAVCSDLHEIDTFGVNIHSDIMALSKLSLNWTLPDIPTEAVHPPSMFDFPKRSLERKLILPDGMVCNVALVTLLYSR